MDACVASTGERCSVIGRSTFSGAGHAGAGHWLGDNYSAWNHLRQAVIGPQEFSLFGMSYTGTDICGFGGESNEELCLRWTQIGAFHTFSRNHNAIGEIRQDPAHWKSEIQKAMNDVLLFRYKYLPEMYTLMYESNYNGATVIRPVSHVFPQDKVTRNLPFQFFWGDSILFSPAVNESQILVDAYFPPEGKRYYDLQTDLELDNIGHIQFNTPLTKFNAHLLGGRILMGHDIDMEYALSNSISTEYLKECNYFMTIGLDENMSARDNFYLDNFREIDPVASNNFMYLEFNFENGRLTSRNLRGEFALHKVPLEYVKILGVKNTVVQEVINYSRGDP